MNGELRATVHERGIVRQRAAIPMQRRIDIRSGAGIHEPAMRAIHEREVEAVGMPVASAWVAVVE